ncbi:menaquinone-specific isochorismate synthase [Salinibacillus kushneri]|uniref:Isochorismate synthase MenF n=1 Tax=Salinibacillus kushneri TaxID=237682 RepID=A0A1H9Y5V7_9BACI|nr:isochorismate synthase [Salinibacillus kushneri]SES64270.1 menaquinone-specific isochorismate synthase [Salinibacillus kushneri]
MIQTKQQRFTESINEAIGQRAHEDTPQLFSYTEKIAGVDQISPIAVFQNTQSFKGSRIFWTSPEDEVTLIGLGSVYSFNGTEDTNSNRFKQVHSNWKKMLNSIYVDNPYKHPGTGPVFMGGFSFNPEESSQLWRNYSNTQMTLPEYLITIDKNEAFLTYHVWLDKELDIEDSSCAFVKMLETIKRETKHAHNPLAIMNQQAINADEWKRTVKKATGTIENNVMEKVVLARELRVSFNRNIPVSYVLENLLEQQKQSYIFAIESEDDCFIGATPERLVKVENRHLLSTCLAGTSPRGKTLKEDERLGKQLLDDDKNRMEHAFVVDMIKQAVEACSVKVQVPESPVLYKLRNLQHLYTPVQGVLKEGHSILEVVRRLHPTPAMGGVPRDKALTFIQQEENLSRGWYSAPIGWMDAMDNGEFAVAIRSGLIQGDEASLFAGCGIVRDSDAEKEFQETEIKFLPMLMALGGLQ